MKVSRSRIADKRSAQTTEGGGLCCVLGCSQQRTESPKDEDRTAKNSRAKRSKHKNIWGLNTIFLASKTVSTVTSLRDTFIYWPSAAREGYKWELKYEVEQMLFNCEASKYNLPTIEKTILQRAITNSRNMWVKIRWEKFCMSHKKMNLLNCNTMLTIATIFGGSHGLASHLARLLLSLGAPPLSEYPYWASQKYR